MIVNGNALHIPLADGTVQTCVTSPPYYGLRRYLEDDDPNKDCEIGLEETPEEYIEKMVAVFREVRRVLRDDGTCWVNMGDSYASANPCDRRNIVGNGSPDETMQRKSRLIGDLKEKDLMGIPWMLAFALRADGAASPAHMETIERMIHAITDSYDTREEWPDRIAAEVERLEREYIDANYGGWYLRSDIIWAKPNPMPESVRDRPTKAHEYIFLLSKQARYFYDADAVREKNKLESEERYQYSLSGSYTPGSAYPNEKREKPQQWKLNPAGRNKRSVWEVATKPYSGAHFATFPPDLIKPCILAGSREGDVVLDPFSGSGTTGQVAIQHRRKYFGIELNMEYIALSRERTTTDVMLPMMAVTR